VVVFSQPGKVINIAIGLLEGWIQLVDACGVL
jgi:hypothetical protein